MDGADGAKAMDDFWPAFHESEVHATPVMVDFDYDGVMDILLATNDGELLVIKDTVSPLLSPRPRFPASSAQWMPRLQGVQPVHDSLALTPGIFPQAFEELVVYARAWGALNSFNRVPHAWSCDMALSCTGGYHDGEVDQSPGSA